MTPRGIHNNNPGNIRRSSASWLGQAVEQTDPDFVQFSDPSSGIRAIARIMETYQAKDGCKTLRQIIDRWAPPSENDTAAYVADVAHQCGVDPDAPVNVTSPLVMGALVRAIVKHENGVQPYTDAVIARGLQLAGVAPLPT